LSYQKAVKEKKFDHPEVEELYKQLQAKRREVLRPSKEAILYINTLCDRMI
jgi:hypothetical protein